MKKSNTKDEKFQSRDVKRHDLFNIFFLVVVVFLVVRYLTIATDWSLLGTSHIGENYQKEYWIIQYAFFLYVLIDALWIYLIPTCTMQPPSLILIHHAITLVVASTPFFIPQFSWHLAIGMTAEFTTIFLAMKRMLPRGSWPYFLSNLFFYLSWILVRVIVYPTMSVFITYEYVRYSESIGSYVNFVIPAWTAQVMLTALSLYWTVNMLNMVFKGKEKLY
eukprot:gene7478-8269_t